MFRPFDEECEMEPCQAKRATFWLALIIGAALLGAVLVAHAAPLFQAMGNDGRPASLRLLSTPCTNEKVLAALKAQINPRFIAQFKAAKLHWGGRDWASCWIEVDGVVFSIDEEGSKFQPVPRELFKEDSV